MSALPTPTPTSYLEQFDAAAPADRFPLVRRWMSSEPLPFFKELREERPILVTPLCTLLTRFDDVTEVLNMPLVFTVALYIPKMGNGLYLMAHDDDALHTREKSLMRGMLNRDDLTILLHPSTGDAYADHTAHAAWLGGILPLRLDVLRDATGAARR